MLEKTKTRIKAIWQLLYFYLTNNKPLVPLACLRFAVIFFLTGEDYLSAIVLWAYIEHTYFRYYFNKSLVVDIYGKMEVLNQALSIHGKYIGQIIGATNQLLEDKRNESIVAETDELPSKYLVGH